jgi:N-acetylglucosaminyldiphosphoundecaprenol N-acetyl-beta-D-mannosaminyltransferase
VLGVPVDDVTIDEAVDRVFDFVSDGRARHRCHQVATVNVDFVVNALRDPEMLAVLQRTSLSIPDGMPIVWGSKLLNSPLRQRVAGADLVPALVARSVERGARVQLFGAAPGIAVDVARTLREQFPGSIVEGEAGPHFARASDVDPSELESIREFDPDICCVAMGNPKQEEFIARFGAELGVPVMIGIGGTLDFLAGNTRRAPAWMQRTGLEWLHRAMSEPRRLVRRYARDACVFLPRLVRQTWRGRRGVRVGHLVVVECDERSVVDLTHLGRADNVVAAELVAVIRRSALTGRALDVVGEVHRDAFAHIEGLVPLLARLTSLTRGPEDQPSRRRWSRARRSYPGGS